MKKVSTEAKMTEEIHEDIACAKQNACANYQIRLTLGKSFLETVLPDNITKAERIKTLVNPRYQEIYNAIQKNKQISPIDFGEFDMVRSIETTEKARDLNKSDRFCEDDIQNLYELAFAKQFLFYIGDEQGIGLKYLNVEIQNFKKNSQLFKLKSLKEQVAEFVDHAQFNAIMRTYTEVKAGFGSYKLSA